MKKSWIIILLAFSVIFILSSCANYLNSSDDFYGGDVIDGEMLSKLAEEVFSSDESLRPEETADADTTNNATDDAQSEEITDEPISEEDTTTAPNPNDLPPDDEETTEEETTEEETTKREHNGVYYWTDSGSKYHKWSDCGYLKNSTEIFDGTLDEATEAGKEGLCSSCAKK